MPDNNNVQLQSGKAIRLIFEYEGEVVRLISQQPVQMASLTQIYRGSMQPITSIYAMLPVKPRVQRESARSV